MFTNYVYKLCLQIMFTNYVYKLCLQIMFKKRQFNLLIGVMNWYSLFLIVTKRIKNPMGG
jgi:hypothetical protein